MRWRWGLRLGRICADLHFNDFTAEARRRRVNAENTEVFLCGGSLRLRASAVNV